MHVGGNVYVICHVTFFPLILNFNIPISKLAALTYMRLTEPSEGLKIWGCQYYLVDIICPPWLRYN